MDVETLYLNQNALFRTIKQLANQSKRPYVILDQHFMPIVCNEQFTKLMQYEKEDMSRLSFRELWHDEQEPLKIIALEESLKRGVSVKEHLVHIRKNNRFFHVKIECLPFQNEEHRTVFTVVFLEDKTYKRMFEFLNQIEKKVFIAIQQDIPMGEKLFIISESFNQVMQFNGLTVITIKKRSDWKITHSKKITEYVTSTSREDVERVAYYERCLALEQLTVFDDASQMNVPKLYEQFMKENDLDQYAVIPIQKADAEKIGNIIFYFNDKLAEKELYQHIIKKIVDLILLVVSYEEKQEEIYRLAYVDLPTGMMNHAGFIEQVKTSKIVDGELQLVEPTELSRVIEVYGRDTGEQLLRAIYERILSQIETKCIYVGRFTSTSISLFMTRQLADEQPIGELLQYLVAEPYIIGDIEIYITLKSGGVLVNNGMLLKDAIRFADSALSDVREKSGTCSAFYSKEKEAQLTKELNMIVHLVHAVKNKEITAFFQPKVELRRGRITSMEALARWISPTLGFVSPADFIPIAEKAGLIREIDLQIIESVLQWLQQRQYEGKRIVPIAVNISPEHFYHPHFLSELQHLIQKYYADPNYLLIEITESLGLVDIGRAEKIIQQLYLKGLRTSVDDFGMGYSSLSYLQKLMFTELKIDRSFTSRIHEVGTLSIVKSLIQIAHNLEMDVVAEGVETEEQAKILYAEGCACAQGYYFYKPMSFAEIEEKRILE